MLFIISGLITYEINKVIDKFLVHLYYKFI